MINKLAPAGMEIFFRAKEKSVPGEISRVKFNEEFLNDRLVRSPGVDTFTASTKSEQPQPEPEQETKDGDDDKGNA